MAIRNIVQLGDEVLRKKSFPVTEFGEKTNQLLDDMKDTLIFANGAGLAAPQVGVLRRIFIVFAENKYYECINPVILRQSGKQVGEEGCLSIKNKYGVVCRPKEITIKAQDRRGRFFTLTVSDFTARAFCHEYDHLDGILYIDKAVSVENENS